MWASYTQQQSSSNETPTRQQTERANSGATHSSKQKRYADSANAREEDRGDSSRSGRGAARKRAIAEAAQHSAAHHVDGSRFSQTPINNHFSQDLSPQPISLTKAKRMRTTTVETGREGVQTPRRQRKRKQTTAERQTGQKKQKVAASIRVSTLTVARTTAGQYQWRTSQYREEGAAPLARWKLVYDDGG